VGKHPQSAPGTRRRVAVRKVPESAGAGGELLRLVGGQPCWQRCAEHSEPSRLGAALELRAQVRSQVGCASLEPNLEVVARCRGHRWRLEPGRQRCSRSGFICATSIGWCFVSAPLNPPFVTDGRLDDGGGVSGGGPQPERSG
jgi:hypothetical protein